MSAHKKKYQISVYFISDFSEKGGVLLSVLWLKELKKSVYCVMWKMKNRAVVVGLEVRVEESESSILIPAQIVEFECSSSQSKNMYIHMVGHTIKRWFS